MTATENKGLHAFALAVVICLVVLTLGVRRHEARLDALGAPQTQPIEEVCGEKA